MPFKLDEKEIISCMRYQDSHLFASLHKIYAQQIHCTVASKFQLNLPTEICSEIAALAHNNKELQNIIKTRYIGNISIPNMDIKHLFI